MHQNNFIFYISPKFSTKFQVNESVSAFLGGSGKHSITTFDWDTLTYHEQQFQLQNVRFRSACATLKKDNGDPVVVILGGAGANSKGMELWDIKEGLLESIFEIPPDMESMSEGLQEAQIIPINGGS